MPNPRHNPERDLGRWVVLNGDIANQITRKILEIVGSFEQSDVARSEVVGSFGRVSKQIACNGSICCSKFPTISLVMPETLNYFLRIARNSDLIPD